MASQCAVDPTKMQQCGMIASKTLVMRVMVVVVFITSMIDNGRQHRHRNNSSAMAVVLHTSTYACVRMITVFVKCCL